MWVLLGSEIRKNKLVVSCLGGKREDTDAGPEHTAWREFWEESGKVKKYGRKAEQCINLSRRNSHRSVSKRFMPSPAVYFTGCWRIIFVVSDRSLRKGLRFLFSLPCHETRPVAISRAAAMGQGQYVCAF